MQNLWSHNNFLPDTVIVLQNDESHHDYLNTSRIFGTYSIALPEGLMPKTENKNTRSSDAERDIKKIIKKNTKYNDYNISIININTSFKNKKKTIKILQKIYRHYFEHRLRLFGIAISCKEKIDDIISEVSGRRSVFDEKGYWKYMRSPKLCPHLLVCNGESTTEVLHLCNGDLLELSGSMHHHWLAGKFNETKAKNCQLIHEAQELNSFLPDAYQLARASVVAAEASRHVSGYGNSLSTHTDFTKRPILIRETLKNWQEQYRIPTFEKSEANLVVRGETSGSTGLGGLISIATEQVVADRESLTRLIWKDAHRPRTAIINRPHNVFGYLNDAEAFHSRQTSDNHLKISLGTNPTRINKDSLRKACELLLAFSPEVIVSEAHYADALVQFLAEHKITLPFLKKIILGFSYTWAFQQKRIQTIAGVPVYKLYHSGEITFMGAECVNGGLHLLEASTLYEIFNHGRPISSGEMGALVVTPLDNPIMPLIRYAIGDVLSWNKVKCACNSPYRTVHFEGRLANLFADGRGEVVTQRRIDKIISPLADFRYVQIRLYADTIMLGIVDDTKEQSILYCQQALEESLAMPVQVQRLPYIPLLCPNGKIASMDTPNNTPYWLNYFGITDMCLPSENHKNNLLKHPI